MHGLLPRSLPSPIPYDCGLWSGVPRSSFCGDLCRSAGFASAAVRKDLRALVLVRCRVLRLWFHLLWGERQLHLLGGPPPTTNVHTGCLWFRDHTIEAEGYICIVSTLLHAVLFV